MWWSFALAAGSIFGIWLVTRRPKFGWYWCFGMEGLWILWGALTKQWGILALCCCYAFIYVHNAVKGSVRPAPSDAHGEQNKCDECEREHGSHKASK